jgi:hypothetical protein
MHLPRPLGAFKPHFNPMPDDYYPNSVCDIILVVLFLIVTVGGTFGILIGFIFWDLQIGNPQFVLIWSIVLVVFLVLMFIAIFLGGKTKLLQDKKMIRDRLQQLQDQAHI